MATPLEWTRLALGIMGAVVYILVGTAVGGRPTSLDAKLGMRAFQTWWFGLATLTLSGPLFFIMDAAWPDGQAFGFQIFVLNLVIIILVAALAGLLYYLLFVYTGNHAVLWPVLAYALLMTAWLVTLIMQANPIGYGEGCENGGFCYEHKPTGESTSLLLSLSLFVPILLATCAYFLLYFRVTEPLQRRRIAMVAGALLGWFGTSLAASLITIQAANADGVVETMRLNNWPYWRVISSLVSLAAALVILWAYRLQDRRRDLPVAT